MPNEPRPAGPQEFAIRTLSGVWRDRARTGAAVLWLHDGALEIIGSAGEGIAEPYDVFSGASCRAGCLELHGEAGSLRLEADAALDQAWVTLVARACAVPEFARGLRVLGSRRGGDASAQARFFAPLIQARRRLEEETEIERRLDAFPARALAERVRQVITALAVERYPKGGADRRALEAELIDALEALFDRFEALDSSAARFRAASERVLFAHWRAWLADVAGVFADADRGWSAAVQFLPPVPVTAARRRGARGGGAARALFLLCLVSSILHPPSSIGQDSLGAAIPAWIR